MPPAEHVQRQIAVAIVVAVEEATFLVAVQRIVRGIEVENDLLGRRPVRLEEEVDEQPLDRRAVMADLMVTARARRRVLEPVQRALAGQRSTVLALGLELAGERRQHRVVAQLIVIDQVLVAKRDAEHPLRHHGLDRVLDLRQRPAVDEAGGEPPDQTDRPIGRAEQQRRRRPRCSRRRRTPPPPDGPRPLHNRTGRGYTVSASGNSSAPA